MAQMFPDSASTRVVFSSRAEEDFYNLCRDSLSENWMVYYSCTLSGFEHHKGLVDNEIDFVLYHKDYGLVALEVKGGQISFDAAKVQFFSRNRFGKIFRIKNPFQQALNWKARFIRYLKRFQLKVPMSYGVVFPQAQEDDFPISSGVEAQLILGMSRLKDLEKSLKHLVLKSQPTQYLDFSDISEELRKILKGSSFKTKIRLREYIDSNELRLRDIEGMQETLVQPLAASDRVAVEGEAGTGKTLLAFLLAERFIGTGQQILLLTSNPILSAELNIKLGKAVQCMTYEAFAGAHGIDLLRTPQNFHGEKDDWVQLEGPALLEKKIKESSLRYEVILCDEAQDVQPFWWSAIEAALKPQGRFYIFFDRSQGVFGSMGDQEAFVPEDVLPIPSPYFCLLNNYRTTKEIATFSRQFRTGKKILSSHASRLGFKPQLETYGSAEDCLEKLEHLIEKLVDEEGIREQEITLLSGRSPFKEGSIFFEKSKIGRFNLLDLGTKGTRSHGALEGKPGHIKISTIASFKGLETSIAILCNISEHKLELSHPIMSSLFYVASTRAKHMLYIFARAADEKSNLVRAAIEKVQEVGAISRCGKDGNHKLTGTVVHYSPARVGWIELGEALEVSDGDPQSSKIMFLPSDLAESEVSRLRIGQKVSFRLQVEGYGQFACDIESLNLIKSS